MKVTLTILFLTTLTGVALAFFICWGHAWQGVAELDLELHRTEMSVGHGSRTGRVREDLVGTVKKGQTVSVLYDTYGKDYWACYVRTDNGQFGWLLCTDIAQN